VRRRSKAVERIDHIGLTDVIEQVSEPFTLAPGHPLRGQRCLLCAALIGGQPCRLAALTDLRGGGCDCGAIDTITMLICGDHGDGAETNWLDTLTGRWLMHHGKVIA
jgi:hypothetical protein